MSDGTALRLPLSACLIARDEERNLPRALASVDFAAEIIVVLDARTRDRSAEIVRGFDRPDRPARVVPREWAGHVAQKNAALDLATREWILSIDADERVSPDLAAELGRLFSSGPGAAGYTVNRRTLYLGCWMRGGGWYPDRKLRLVRRGRGRWAGTDPHDRLEAEGPVEALRGDLLHGSYRDLEDHIRKIDSFTSIAAREKFLGAGGRPSAPVLRMLIHAPARFFRMYILRRGFRDGMRGMIAALLGAFYVFLKYAKVWEMVQAERRVAGSARFLDPESRPLLGTPPVPLAAQAPRGTGSPSAAQSTRPPPAGPGL